MRHTKAQINYDAVDPIVDGDTVKMQDEEGLTFTLRLRDIDTRETYTVQGEEDAVWVDRWLRDAESRWREDDYPFRVFTLADEWERGSYGRRLGFIARRDTDTPDLLATSLLTERGNAVGWYDEK